MIDFLNEHMLVLILAVAGLATYVWLLLFRQRLKMTWWSSLLLSVLHVLYGVACVHVFAKFEGAGIGAMSIFGAVFLMPLGYFLGAKLFKRPVTEVFDIFAVPMVFTLFCSRINCLVSGCCTGLEIGHSGLHWPTREAEMLFYLVFLALLAPRVKRAEMRGRVYPLYMVSYGIFRAIIECFRYSPTYNSIFHLTHIWALLSIAIGLSVYFELRERSVPPKTDQNAKKH